VKTITVDGVKYLVRYQNNDLRKLYAAWCRKYGCKMSFVRWLGETGKVYCKVPGA
jgi:hypothetical protein